MNALPAAKALDAFFFEARAESSTWPRSSTALTAARVVPTCSRIRAWTRCAGPCTCCSIATMGAEQVQKIFSLDYDANWERPKPRY